MEDFSMSEPVNIAVIGCGDIAVTRHIPTVAACPDAKLYALCDTDFDRVRKLALEHQVNIFTADYKELLSDPLIQAVIIATPPWITPIVTIECLRAGKHVLCEKPMALDVETARQVLEVEKQTGKKVQVGFTYRHDPLLETLRSWIAEDKLGAPLVYRMGIYDEIWNPSGNPEHYERIRKTMEHGSPSIHDGAHIADFLNFLTQSAVKSVHAFGLKTREEFPSSNYDTSIIRFRNGDLAKLEIAWFLPNFPQGEFEVIGPKGIAIFDRHKRFVQLNSGSETELIAHEDDWGETCFRIQLDKFIKSIRLDLPCVPGAMDGIYSLSLTKDIESAMRQDQQES